MLPPMENVNAPAGRVLNLYWSMLINLLAEAVRLRAALEQTTEELAEARQRIKDLEE